MTGRWYLLVAAKKTLPAHHAPATARIHWPAVPAELANAGHSLECSQAGAANPAVHAVSAVTNAACLRPAPARSKNGSRITQPVARTTVALPHQSIRTPIICSAARSRLCSATRVITKKNRCRIHQAVPAYATPQNADAASHIHG